MKKLFFLLITTLIFSRLLNAQTCKVTDFIYLNDPQDYQTQGFVHKLKIGTGGTLTEVSNGLGNIPWFPQGGGLGSPHGLGQDLNGNLYIGANSDTGPIAKITCEGTLVNLNFINDAGYNIVSKDGYLFVNSSSDNRIRRYALCDGSAQGYVTLNGSTQLDWGLSISPNGTFYATTGLDPAFASAIGTKAIYRFTPTDADFVNHTSYSPLVSANDVPPGVAAANLPIQSAWLWGITADDAGNMYVIAEDPWFNHQGTTWTGFTWILKYDPNGNLVAWTKDEQTTTPVSGFKGGRGILYYPAKDVLYIAAGQYGDCVAMIKPSDLSYMGAAAGNVPNQNPKTLRIASEACPVNASTKVDTTLCNVKVGDRIFLSQIVGACNAPICGGTWTAAPTNVGMSFNQCDLSFTVTGLNGCGKYTLTNVGGTCGDFTIEVNVDFANITASVITGSQTVCAGMDPVAFSESTPATGSGTVSYQWQKSTTSCTTGFTDIAGATNSTYDPPVVSQTTYYRVVTSVVGGCNFPQKQCSDTSNCVTVTVIPAPAFGGLTISNPTCTGPTANNNGIITLVSALNTDKYGISTAGATTYNGPAYSSALTYTPNKDVQTAIPNTGGTYILRIFNGSNDCYKDSTITIAPVVCCTPPVASVTPKVQTICLGGTASAFTVTPSTGVQYKWYGPLTSVTASLGTAISGATNATFTPTGAALTTAGAKFYAVVVNTTGDAACADTAFVQLNVSQLSVPAVTAQCHANGTPENGADDYMTFSVNVSTTPMIANKFTVTATQAGNPLVVTLSNGSAATAINCGLDTPLRTPVGSAGKGNVTLTITDNVTGCTTTVVVTDPGVCAVTCVQGTPSTVVYEYATQTDITELNSLPIVIPKFDEQGGTRVLQSVKLEYTVGGKTGFAFENRAAQSQTFTAKSTSDAILTLNGTDIATSSLQMAIPTTTFQGGILVPATGAWSGDSIPSPVPTPTTLGRMVSWVSDYLTVFKDPRTDARWVTNATGDVTDDDDMYVAPLLSDSKSGVFTYTSAADLSPFIGTGTVPLEVSTLSGLSTTGGGGNISVIQRTRAYASAKVTYTYSCILCTKPLASATSKTQSVCVGGTASAYTATPSTGVDYKWYGPLSDTTSSLGTAVSGAISASFTPTGSALTTAGTKYYAVVVNTTGDVNCADTAFVQLVVNAKPVIVDGSATICAGESVDLTSKITNYATYSSPVWTVGTASGTAVTTPASVKPTTTTTYVLVAQNAAGCKDTANVVVTVNQKPSAGKDTTLACVNAATNTLATSYTLVPSPAGGTWSQIGTTPASATITGNNVTGMTVTGTYQFVYTSAAGCKDTVAVTVAPCAGCVKPNAGADAMAVCQPTSTAKLTAVTTGGTWAPIGSPANPSAASIDASGNITGLNAAGTYKFVYSVSSGGQTCTDTAQVVVNAKPNIADGTAIICAGESVDLTSKITNYATYLSPVWTVGTASGTAVTTPSSVKPTTTTTYVLVAQNAAGCKDTANVVVTVNQKPSAGKDTTLACSNGSVPSSVQLSATPAGGTWSSLTGNPTGATVSSAGVVSITNATAQGKSFDFIYSVNGCQDTVKVIVPVCVQPKGSIGDYVWKDQNNNGVQESGEPSVAGVIVQLLNSTTSAVLATDTTDASGLYLFSNLSSGTYQVKIVTTSLPAGCVISSKQDLGGDDTKDSDFNPTTGLSQVVTIDALGTGVAKDNPTVDAGLYSPKGSIGDYVWKDQNNNGVQESGEPAVAGVIVQLLNSTTSAVLATDTTDANGLYLFSNLSSGTYQVKIVTTSLPAGCVISSKQDLGGDDTKDSDFNPTTGLSQVVTIDALGTGVAKDNPTVDAGLYSPKGSIGDYVWKDQNNNGVQESGEPAVAGVIVQLLNSTTSAVLATDTTDASGLYLFSNLNSGTYQVKIVTASLPAGCIISTKQDLGGDDTKDSDFNPTTGLSQVVTIDALGTGVAKDNPTVDAGLYSPKGSIGDYVWKDQNNNGVQESGEPAVAGVIAQLLNSTTSAVLATDTTDASGLYLFSNLSSGTYQVKIVTTSLPAGCVISSKQDLGGDDTKDSDFNPTTGLSQVVTIDALGTGVAKDNPTVDAGLYSPKGSIGDYVWKDQNNNGVQESGEPAVAGVIVQLLNSTTSAVLATDTTDASGLYLFSNLSSGTYQVKIVTASLPAGCIISTKQDLGGDDTKDSDFNPTTGLSQVVTIDALGTGVAKDNPTVDAGLVVPCVESTVTLSSAPVCSADVQTYSITFTVNNKLGIVKVNKGTISGSNPYTVTGIPSGASVIITDSLSALCKSDTTIVGPNCNCNPPVPVLLAPSMTACIGDTFPTLKATVVGLATVEWFSQQTGGTLLSTGVNYKPSGTVTGTVTYYAQARSTDPTCPTAISTSRVAANINAQSCIDTIDLALKKSIDKKIARVGDVLTYTIKVWNQWTKNATGVEVTDSIATTVQFVSGSFIPSRGSATISGNVIKWNIGTILAAGAPANGDTVTLSYQVKATQAGVHLNTAEISKTNEKDRDSTPGNGKGGEDDIDQQCFTVSYGLCAGQKLEVSVPAGLMNVQWFKNGGTTAVATGNVVLLSEVGTYTFTATNQTCPANGCCPVIIEAGTNCCPVDICIPYIVRKVKK